MYKIFTDSPTKGVGESTTLRLGESTTLRLGESGSRCLNIFLKLSDSASRGVVDSLTR
jgi:hypothetical protein